MAENEKNGDSKERLILPPFPLTSLSELIGQDDIRKRLTAAVKAAQSGTARVPHILFDGPPGPARGLLPDLSRWNWREGGTPFPVPNSKRSLTLSLI